MTIPHTNNRLEIESLVFHYLPLPILFLSYAALAAPVPLSFYQRKAHKTPFNPPSLLYNPTSHHCISLLLLPLHAFMSFLLINSLSGGCVALGLDAHPAAVLLPVGHK